MTTCRITVVTFAACARGPPALHAGSPGKGRSRAAFSSRRRPSSKPPGKPGVCPEISPCRVWPGRPGLHPARHEAGSHAGPGQVRPAWQGGGAPQGTPPLVSYFFRFSATSSAMCETLTFMPCFSTPPRSCMTQPGQSMTTREAPVSSMCFSFLASSVPEISGNFME